jgi:prepilin-type N-terminal cleavage/methylation domain-containing protein
MSKTRKSIQNDNGFTLVELMVTVFLTAIAVISIYRGYTAFSQSADAQQQVMEMQQNLRIGMTRLAVDIRRAGMNEEYKKEARFLCDEVPTNDTRIEFSMDLLGGDTAGDDDDDGLTDEEDESRIGDGDTEDYGEKIIYYLAASSLDPTTNDLRREVWDSTLAPPDYGTAQTLITNVEAVDFVYFDDTGAEFVPSVPPATGTDKCDGVDPADPDPDQRLSLWGGQLQEVDRVEITLVVRATNEDSRYTNKEIYRNLRGEQVWPPLPPPPPPPDNFRRRVFSMSVQIRNNI